MNDKYKYILYVLVFISISVLSLFVIKFYKQYMVPNIEAEITQKEQIEQLIQLNEVNRHKCHEQEENKQIIGELNSKILNLENDINLINENSQKTINKINKKYNEEIVSLNNQISILKKQADTLMQKDCDAKTYILKNKYDEEISSLKAQLIESNILLKKRVSEIKIEYQNIITTLNDELNNEKENKNKYDSEISSLKEQLNEYNTLLEKKDLELELKYKNTINLLKSEINYYSEQYDLLEQDRYFEEQKEIKKYIVEIEQLNNLISEYENEITELELKNSKVDQSIDENRDKKYVYLTFDDGPSKMTIPILDILDKYNIKATFFVLLHKGYDYEYKQIYQRGHTIGNHTSSHDYSYIYASVDNFYESAKRLDDYIYSLTKSKTIILRFPGGTNSSWTKNKIKMQIMEESYKRGYIYFDWNASSGDGAVDVYSAEDIFKNATKTFDNEHDVFLLMHDSVKTYTTVDALDNLIEFYLSKGYEFLPITYKTPQCKLYNP